MDHFPQKIHETIGSIFPVIYFPFSCSPSHLPALPALSAIEGPVLSAIEGPVLSAIEGPALRALRVLRGSKKSVFFAIQNSKLIITNCQKSLIFG